MKKFISVGILLGAMPFFAFAQSASAISIVQTIGQILGYVVPVLISLAVVYFIWGVIQYTVSSDEEAKKKAKTGIVQGLIGLFVIIAFWGIITVVTNTFGVGSVQLQSTQIPCVPGSGSPNC